MKYFSRLGLHKNSTGTNKIDIENVKAWSYDWWVYLTKVNGLVIFNNTTYSPSTNKHQSDCRRLLDYKYDIELRYTTKSLDNIKEAINDEVFNRLKVVKGLQLLINKKGTRKTTNVKRQLLINDHRDFISMLKMSQLGE